MKRKHKKNRKLFVIITVLLAAVIVVKLAWNMNDQSTNNKESNFDEHHKAEVPDLNNKETDEPNKLEKPLEPEEDPASSDPNPLEPGSTVESPEYIVIIEKPDAIDVLVNKTYNLPSTYVPQDLVSLDDVPTVLANPEVNQLRKVAYEALKELFEAAREEGYFLYARSGYRSYSTQSSLYESYVKNHGQSAADKYSAKPGQSEHQTGLAMDITCEAVNYQLDSIFGDTEEGKWVSENAHKYGFIVRYPKGKEDITGYNYEPWHIRYLGKELATEVYESGLTLEEFFQ